MKKTLITIATLLAATSVFAQPPGGGGPPTAEALMTRNDTNKDGVISKEEAEASKGRIAQMFDTLDTNKDGKISMDELKAAMAGGAFARGPGGPGGPGGAPRPRPPGSGN